MAKLIGLRQHVVIITATNRNRNVKWQLKELTNSHGGDFLPGGPFVGCRNRRLLCVAGPQLLCLRRWDRLVFLREKMPPRIAVRKMKGPIQPKLEVLKILILSKHPRNLGRVPLGDEG